MRKTAVTLGRYLVSAGTLGVIVFLGHKVVSVNATTVAMLMLLVVLGVATRWGLAHAIFTSVVAVLGLNYFFLPPIGTLTISDPENWIALFAFLATSVTVSQLSAQAKRRTEEAVAGRNELSKLYELSRAMLMDEARDAVRVAVTKTGQILELRHIAFFDAATDQIYGSLDGSGVSEPELRHAAASGESTETIVPVRLGAKVIGSIGMEGVHLSTSIRNSVASLLAINYERVRALDRAAAAQVAQRNEEFKSSLLDGLAHDLKTPLTAIRTCVTHLISTPPRTQELSQELLSIIDQESQRLQQSITEAIELARIESQELHLNRELIDAAKLLRRAIAETRDENPARFEISVPEGIAVDVDADLFRRALQQILENARKYSPPNSPVQLDVHIEDHQLVLSISDRGPGIRQDEAEKVFDKFYRGQAGTADVEGTGMGLAIARSIIEAHGGKIRAQNRPGGGATIVITLPANQ